jgi:SAM-dependent methyltransferase
MNRSPTKPQGPGASSTPKDASGAHQGAEAEEVVDHDPTLKWIISDFADMGVTPPPAVPGEPLPPPPGVRAEPDVVVPAALDAEKIPSPFPLAADRVVGPAAEPPTPSAAQSETRNEAGTDTQGDYLGAAPSDFFTADPTPPPPPKAPAPDSALGAAPVEILVGASGSDSEIADDAVELIATPPEETEPLTSEVSARMPSGEAATPSMPASVPRVEEAQSPGTTEPREVEAEALEELESAEQALPEVKQATPALTPPPVPAEITARAAAARPVENKSPDGAVAPTRQREATGPVPAARPQDKAPAPSTPQAKASVSEPIGASPATPAPASTTARTEDGGLPEALATRPLQKRSKPWYEEVFDEDYLRTLPFMTADQTAREASFIREALVPPAGGEILDVGCGYGRHALELANTGLRLTGLDLSLPLLIRAADQAQKRGLSVNFVHADMREMTFNAQFDGAYCMMSTFGYFDEETNLRVASAIYRALKPGGRFLLDIINRDYIVGDLPSRVWWEGDGCVVLEEVDFNHHTSRVLIRRSVVFGNGRQNEQEISMRAYSLHELGKILRQAGLRVLDVSGGLATKSKFFGAASRNIIALCERPAL